MNVTLSDDFNEPIRQEDLPAELVSLTFGRDFNQVILPGILPASLQTLTFGGSFNQIIGQGVLPVGLKNLTFGSDFNQPILEKVLPSSLENLFLDGVFNQPIGQRVLPNSLHTLMFAWRFNQRFIHETLPSSLKVLKLGNAFNQPLEQGVLPNSLQSLQFGWSFNKPLEEGVLPASLQNLIFGNNFNQPIGQKVLPASLQDLTFGNNFNQPIEPGVFPLSLYKLRFGNAFNQPFGQAGLPPLLQELRLGAEYQQRLFMSLLPSSLQIISLEKMIKYRLDLDRLPLSLKSFIINGKNQFDWLQSLRRINAAHIHEVGDLLRELYISGYPIPVEPHMNTQLYYFSEILDKLRLFSIDRNYHKKYIVKNPDQRLKKLVKAWVDEDYYDFNQAVSDFNEKIPIGPVSYSFTRDVDIETFEESYQLLRNSILSAPRLYKTIFAWRGLTIGDELCEDIQVGDLVGFSRFMACSVAQEVSCDFAEGGELLLLELPPGCPFLNITSLKKSEPEFLLPDRSCFIMVNRIPNNWCFRAECLNILHLRFVGIYSTESSGMEFVLEDLPDQEDMIIF
jgi:hypothetical protein